VRLFVIKVVLKAVLLCKDEALQFKSARGRCMSKCLKEDSAVVKKKFRLRKT